eukprot:10584097-Ditylum_brightwellii.AAC.1
MTTRWNGRKYTLEGFYSQHRVKYQQLVEAAQHVKFQVSNKHTMADSILLPVNPNSKNKATGKKDVSFEISAVEFNKFGQCSKPNVDLCWYKCEEFNALSGEEQAEIRAWQQTRDGQATVKKQKNDFFSGKTCCNNKCGGSTNVEGDSTEKKMLHCQVTSLEKQLEEHGTNKTVLEVAAALK